MTSGTDISVCAARQKCLCYQCGRDKQIMARQAIVQGDSLDEDKKRDAALRPRLLREVIGQQSVKQRLEILIKASKKLQEPMSHILFDGPPGLGKTTFATVLPNELGTSIQMTSGPALTRPADMLPFLTNAAEGSILFIDEIHRMPRVVEEFIYPAMEDFRIDIVLGEGINARTLSMTLKRFTLIGATTRSGMLSSPMRARFKIHEHLDYYTVEELAEILQVNARKLNTPLAPDAALEIAQRSRGTPRIANARLWWARSFSASERDGAINIETAREALKMAEVDLLGLDKQDRRYLETLVKVFEGGPTGVEAIAATMNLAADTISDEIEPYLLREQMIVRTPRGRMATSKAYQHVGAPPRRGSQDSQGALFS
jgi:Holliday junction DNA helicase RuvB